MDMETLRRRVELVFNNAEQDEDKFRFTATYLSWLRENIIDINKKLYKTAYSLVILSVISFYLLYYDVSGIEFNFIDIKDMSVLIKFLPVIISYLYMEFIDKSIYDLLIGAFAALLVHTGHEEMYKHRLHLFVAPYSLYHVANIINVHIANKKNKIINFINKSIGQILLCTPLLLIFNYIKLYLKYSQDLTLILSLVISATFCYHGIVNALRSRDFALQTFKLYEALDKLDRDKA